MEMGNNLQTTTKQRPQMGPQCSKEVLSRPLNKSIFNMCYVTSPFFCNTRIIFDKFKSKSVSVIPIFFISMIFLIFNFLSDILLPIETLRDWNKAQPQYFNSFSYMMVRTIFVILLNTLYIIDISIIIVSYNRVCNFT